VNKILIATGNRNKFNEIAGELDEIGIETLFSADDNIKLERPESGHTYLENARIKADEGFDKSGLPSLADDSGLEVEALDRAPGIHSDRWAPEADSAAEKNDYLLAKMEGIPLNERTAEFVCEMVLVDQTGQRFTSRGVCEGRIAFEQRGEHGFGYDPIFEARQAKWKTFAELPPKTKNWISHRALALNRMISLIRQYMAENF